MKFVCLFCWNIQRDRRILRLRNEDYYLIGLKPKTKSKQKPFPAWVQEKKERNAMAKKPEEEEEEEEEEEKNNTHIIHVSQNSESHF